jgi:chromate transporter
MVLQFVGYLAAYRNPGALDPIWAGTLGAAVTTWVTFAPCFLWIFLGAPYIEALRGNRNLSAALSAITAAVVGVVLNLAVWFTVNTIFGRVEDVYALGMHLLVPVWATLNLPALAIAAFAALAIFRLKLSLLKTIAISAGLGVAYHLALLART